MKTFITAIILLSANYTFSKNHTINVFSIYLESYVQNVRIYNESGTLLGETDKYGDYIIDNSIDKNEKLTLKHSNFKDTTIVFGKVNHSIVLEFNDDFEKQIKLEDPNKWTFSDTSNVKKKTDIAPEFNGGRTAFLKFLMENVRYPQVAIEYDINGKVYLNFIIEVDGSVNEVIVQKSVSRTIDKEAIRVVKASSKMWLPGKINGQPVRTYFTVPINFNLQ
jgi:TonB family protein